MAMPWACGGGGVQVPLRGFLAQGWGPEQGRGRWMSGVKADENVFVFISLFQVHQPGEQAFPF